MTRLLSKFYIPEGHIINFYVSTGTTAKACLFASKHFKSFLCEAYECCVTNSMHFVFNAFARQVLNVKSNINEPEEIQQATKRYLQEKKCAVKSQQKDLRQAARKFSAVQMFA